MSGDPTLSTLMVPVVGAFLCLALAAYFAAAEAALARLPGSAVEAMVRAGRRGSAMLAAVHAAPTRHINGLLLLRTGCEVAAVLLAGTALVLVLGLTPLALLTTAAVMIAADYLAVGVAPRLLARRFPESTALAAVPVLRPLGAALAPAARFAEALGRRLSPRGPEEGEDPYVGEDELRHLVDLAEERKLIDAEEREMIHSVFQLDDTAVRDVMVPRTDIVFVSAHATVNDALALALRTGFSRIPVTGDGVDDVVGIANLKDLVAHLWGPGDSSGAQAPVAEIMREAGYVPDSKPVDELLREMRQRRLHLAVVIDEYGGTAGLVTMEDIVEEIVGEITDEYDDTPQTVEWVGSGKARVPGRLAIAELAELFDTDIDVEELDVGTVSGLLAYALGRVPVVGSTADYAGLRLTAETPAGRRHRTAVVVVERFQKEEAKP